MQPTFHPLNTSVTHKDSLLGLKVIDHFLECSYQRKKSYLFGSIASLHHIEKLGMTMSHSQLSSQNPCLLMFIYCFYLGCQSQILVRCG